MSDLDWQDIGSAPDDFDRPGGQRPLMLRDRDDRVVKGRRALFNNSGWLDSATNREFWPVYWAWPARPVQPEGDGR